MSQHIKKPIALSLGQTIQNRITDAEQLKGKALPCSVVASDGNFVTINFEIDTSFTLPVVTIPIARTAYISYPVQPGDTGVAIPADALLGGVSGESGVTATFLPPSNLGALFFIPLGNIGFTLVNPLQVAIAGPGGVVLSDEAVTHTITISTAGIALNSPLLVSATCGASSVTLTPTTASIASTTINLTGAVFVNGNPYPT